MFHPSAVSLFISNMRKKFEIAWTVSTEDMRDACPCGCFFTNVWLKCVLINLRAGCVYEFDIKVFPVLATRDSADI